MQDKCKAVMAVMDGLMSKMSHGSDSPILRTIFRSSMLCSLQFPRETILLNRSKVYAQIAAKCFKYLCKNLNTKSNLES